MSAHVWCHVLRYLSLRAVYAFGTAGAAHRRLVRGSGVLSTFPAAHPAHRYRATCAHEFALGPCAACAALPGHRLVGLHHTRAHHGLRRSEMATLPTHRRAHHASRLLVRESDVQRLARETNAHRRAETRRARRRVAGLRHLADVAPGLAAPLLEAYTNNSQTRTQLLAAAHRGECLRVMQRMRAESIRAKKINENHCAP